VKGGAKAGNKAPGKPSGRKARVEHALRDELQALIDANVKDPRVREATLVSVTRVELNVDMAVANVFVRVVPEDAADGVLVGLAKAAGFLRGPVARALQLQRAPELRFAVDTAGYMDDKIAQIRREDEAKAKAAGRVVGEAEPRPPEPVADATGGEDPA
jgi:ribosome-binding factor A